MKGAIEKKSLKQDRRVIGVDEVGRGCLAGPVYAAVAALDYYKIDALEEATRDLIRDSKKLSSKQRQKIIPVLEDVCVEWGLGVATEREIETLGIVPATFLAMKRAFENLKEPYDLLLIDGNQKHPDMPMEQMTVVGGDSLCYAIAAASILAKEARDAVMRIAHESYPQYGFGDHVGYGTKSHLQAIEEHGITPLHRRNFAPIRNMVALEIELV
ncbi:MAG: ribonuclease HII [Proteobacteria bacterium]|nr:MAG: ribonuclease HII [Pseudomonadota bacterium]